MLGIRFSFRRGSGGLLHGPFNFDLHQFVDEEYATYDLLGRRDLDVNYDWARHIGRYYHEEFTTGSF